MPFDFERLEVCKEAKILNKEILLFLKSHKAIDPYIRDQLKRSSISMVINIAEGSGKFSKPDKRNFYTIARSSVYECVSLFDIIEDIYGIDNSFYYQRLERLSKMLFGLINSQK